MTRFSSRLKKPLAARSVVFSFDGEPTINSAQCGECAETHETSVGFVLANDSAFAVYWIAWHPHNNEAWVDLTMGSWNEPDYEDHVMFGCRIGPVDGSDGPQCTAVTAGVGRSDAPLSHEWLSTFWSTIDWLVFNDPLLHEHIFHMGEGLGAPE